MSKQLILITAPFNCGHCKNAQQELPEWTKKNGWEFTEIEDDPKDKLGTETYPTFMIRVNDKMVDTMIGYKGKDQMEINLNKY